MDDEAMNRALDAWMAAQKARNGISAFCAGWRAAMEEARREREHVEKIVREELDEERRWNPPSGRFP